MGTILDAGSNLENGGEVGGQECHIGQSGGVGGGKRRGQAGQGVGCFAIELPFLLDREEVSAEGGVGFSRRTTLHRYVLFM